MAREEYIPEGINRGYIRSSTFPTVSEFFFVEIKIVGYDLVLIIEASMVSWSSTITHCLLSLLPLNR